MKRNIFKLNGGELPEILTPFNNSGYQNPILKVETIDQPKEINKLDNEEALMQSVTCVDMFDSKNMNINSQQKEFNSKSSKIIFSDEKYSQLPNSSPMIRSNELRDQMSKALIQPGVLPFSKADDVSVDHQNSKEENEDQDNLHETSAEQEKRIRKQSIFGHLKTWKLLRLIVKSGDDLRQEQFAMQLINQIDQIFKRKKLKIWLKPYEILATGKDCGVIEFLTDTTSIDSYKKKNPNKTLEDFFKDKFKKKKELKKARDNFARSLAGYSLVCFILQIKDRHNGNIMIDNEGHIIHIDFGFMLTNAPGKGLNFEKAPFKLTDEFVNAMNGLESKNFKTFRKKLIEGFLAIQSKAEHLICLVEMMMLSQNDLPCFLGGRERVISELRDRLFPYHGKIMKQNECTEYIDYLISSSYNNWRTRLYMMDFKNDDRE